jgi:hypothetical protein
MLRTVGTWQGQRVCTRGLQQLQLVVVRPGPEIPTYQTVDVPNKDAHSPELQPCMQAGRAAAQAGYQLEEPA